MMASYSAWTISESQREAVASPASSLEGGGEAADAHTCARRKLGDGLEGQAGAKARPARARGLTDMRLVAETHWLAAVAAGAARRAAAFGEQHAAVRRACDGMCGVASVSFSSLSQKRFRVCVCVGGGVCGC